MRKILLLLLVTGILQAEEQTEEKQYTAVGSRHLPKELQQELQENRQQERLEHPEETTKQEGTTLSLDASLPKYAAGIYLPDDAIFYPGYDHCISYISYDGRVGELEDGSQWFVTRNDTAVSVGWLPGDGIAIYNNTDFFGYTKYKLVNCTTGQTVRADLTRGPYVGSPYSKIVVAVDTKYDAVYLSDGTRWDASWSYSSQLVHWLPGDVIIIGFNGGWFSGSYPGILINVTLDEYIPVKRAM